MDNLDQQLSDEQRLAIEQEYAMQAKIVLENPAFTKAVQEIRGAILAAWAGTKPLQTAEREEYQRRFVTLDAIVGILRDYLATGTMRGLQLAEEQEQEKRQSFIERFWKWGFDTKPPEGEVT